MKDRKAEQEEIAGQVKEANKDVKAKEKEAGKSQKDLDECN